VLQAFSLAAASGARGAPATNCRWRL